MTTPAPVRKTGRRVSRTCCAGWGRCCSAQDDGVIVGPQRALDGVDCVAAGLRMSAAPPFGCSERAWWRPPGGGMLGP